MAGPAALLLLLPEVAHDVVQVLAHQVAPSKVFAHQVPTSQLPNQLLHIRQPTQSSVRSNHCPSKTEDKKMIIILTYCIIVYQF